MSEGSTAEWIVLIDEHNERAVDFGQALVAAKCQYEFFGLSVRSRSLA